MKCEVSFSRTITVEIEVESLDEVTDTAWQEFGSRELRHSQFDITNTVITPD